MDPVGAPLGGRKGAQRLRMKWHDDVVAWTKHVADSASLENSEIVFVGYGVIAPEFNWDDYKGVDAKGKTLVIASTTARKTTPSRSSPLRRR